MLRFRMSEHGPSTRSNLVRSIFTHFNKPRATTVAALGRSSNSAISPVVTYKKQHQYITTTRMWANAQRDGRPAEHRWRSLFNAAVWLMSSTGVPCSNAAKMRNPLKLAGVPQTTGSTSAAIRPKFSILWGDVEEILLLNKFLPIIDTCLSCEDMARQSCAMVPRWLFFGSCISSEPRAVHFRPAF